MCQCADINSNHTPFINNGEWFVWALHQLFTCRPHRTDTDTASGAIAWCFLQQSSAPPSHILIVPFQTFTLSGHQSLVYGGWCMSLSCNRLCFALQAQHHLWETHLTAINHAGSHPTDTFSLPYSLSHSLSLSLSLSHTHKHFFLGGGFLVFFKAVFWWVLPEKWDKASLFVRHHLDRRGLQCFTETNKFIKKALRRCLKLHLTENNNRKQK